MLYFIIIITLQLLNVLNDWSENFKNKNITDCVYIYGLSKSI